MNRSPNYIVWATVLCAIGTACVQAKKYQALQAVQQASESEISRLQRFEQAYEILQKDFQRINQSYEDNGKALRELVAKYDRLNETYNGLLDQYDQLIDEKQQVIQNSSEEMNRLQSIIQDKDRQIEEKQREIWDKEMELENRDTRLAHLSEAMDPRELQAKNLLASWDAVRIVADSLQGQLQHVLAPLDSTVMVRTSNTSVKISIPQPSLFNQESGSISESGKDILRSLGAVSGAYPDWNIDVVGHTSKEGNADFNWDLSVAWAEEVVKELIRSGIDPGRLTACGKSYYDPAYQEESSDGFKNRRVAFVLHPREDLLTQLSGSE